MLCIQAVSSINETSTQRTKSSSSSFRISERSSSSSSKGTNQALSISKPLKSPFVSGATSCHSTVTSDSKPSSPASLEGETSNNHPIQAAENNTVGRMKQQEKEKHVNIRSHKVPKGNKIYEGPKVDGKQKPKNGRHSCTSVYSSSRTGRLAVGVATWMWFPSPYKHVPLWWAQHQTVSVYLYEVVRCNFLLREVSFLHWISCMGCKV